MPRSRWSPKPASARAGCCTNSRPGPKHGPQTFYVFRGRATPQTQGQPFGLLRDILAWRLQIADDDSIEVARAKMEQGIMPLFERDDGADVAQGHAHLLGHLIGIEWRESRHVARHRRRPEQIRNRALHAAAQLFRT